MEPMQFMRHRRPELFSDSERTGKSLLTRALLGYHLESLTSRKEEVVFETFCRRLAEKEICPNLRPQTGPTGGGDSRTDSETIPVSSEIAMRWIGINPAAANERWAFAFSAKKTWRAKVRSDVESAAGTDRGYKRIFFITNQYAPDKARAALEDELSKKYGIPLTILDRSWIEKVVFENDRIQIAVEALNLTGLEGRDENRLGPRDLKRQQELQQLETEISDPDRYQGALYQLAEDCLSAALLARGLEKPRTEVEGCFARAERIADQVNSIKQRLRIAYHRAWTEFCWYGDSMQLSHLYGVVQEFAIGSAQVEDLEKLYTLWQLLITAIRKGDLDPERARIADRTTKLRSALDCLAGDDTRPNNALGAQTNRLLIDLNFAFEDGDEDKINAVWVAFTEVIARAQRLGDYPVEHLAALLQEMGQFVPDSQAYDEMFDRLVELLETHRSEGEGGIALLERGFQKLKAAKPYDAIRFFGRAQERLTKREYRRHLVAALGGCAHAYEQVGLLWAARNCVLEAVERCLAFFHEDGEVVRPALPCLQKLTQLEIQLGRIPRVLESIELTSALVSLMKLEPDRADALEEEHRQQDVILGLHMLKASLAQLREMESLPDTLERFDLLHSRLALMYALGREAELRAQGFIPESETAESVREFFATWINQPAASEIPDAPNLMTDDTVEFNSNVLGCRLVVTASSNKVSIYLAESLLGALEAFLSTSLNAGVVPFRQEAKVTVEPSPTVFGKSTISIQDVCGEPVVQIRHAPEMPPQTSEMRAAAGDWMIEAIARIMTHIAIVDDVEGHLKRIIGGERAFARVSHVSEVAIVAGNVFGDNPRLQLTDWISEDSQRYPLNRAEVWNAGLAAKTAEPKKAPLLKPGGDAPPPGLFEGLDRLTHRQQRIESLIDIPLWDKAKWGATLYVQDPSRLPHLLMGLGFGDIEAGRAIFAGWRKRLGTVDDRDELRVSIVTGIDRANPYAYRVVIGTNPKIDPNEPENQYVIMVSRINRMTPTSPRNLEVFQEGFRKWGLYLIAPVYFTDAKTYPKIHGDLAIAKKTLVVRPAWQIGPNDPDICAISQDDDPIIPENVTDAPLLSALRQRSTMRNHRPNVTADRDDSC